MNIGARAWWFAVAGVVLAVARVGAAEAAATNKWEGDIARFEALDRTNPPPAGAVLFTGSSSIRLWKTLRQDFPDLAVINRGFGGSGLGDAVRYFDRLVLPYRPRAVVLYAGENDLAGGAAPETVAENFRAFVAKLRQALPEVPLYYIAMKPSPSRWHLEAKFRAGNEMIRGHAATQDRVTFVDVFTPMLGADGEPRPELFVADRLHLNAEGYALWTGILTPRLREHAPEPAGAAR